MIRILPGKWDLQADVIAIGSGGGGLAAAITAPDRGASALVPLWTRTSYPVRRGLASFRWEGFQLNCIQTAGTPLRHSLVQRCSCRVSKVSEKALQNQQCEY